MKETGAGFCFDVNHALIGIKHFENYEFIEEYIKLNPNHYHIGGQRSLNGETHISFFKFRFKFERDFEILPRKF